MPEHHTFSINLDDNFHNILSDGEKTRVYSVEVGRVWLELPSSIHSYKPNTSSIRKLSSTRIIIPSTSRPLYIYIYILGLWYRKSCESELEIIPNNLAAA